MAIVTMQRSLSIAANSTNQNVLQGERYERAPYNAAGSLYCCGSATGLTAELNVGGNSITPATTVNAQNRLPVVPDDVLTADWEAVEGDLIQVSVVNTTGGALTFFYRVDLELVSFGE